MVKQYTRGKSKTDLSLGQRNSIEKRLKKVKSKIDRNAKRLLPKMRVMDRERRAGSKKQEK
jgi:hypothetical protein